MINDWEINDFFQRSTFWYALSLVQAQTLILTGRLALLSLPRALPLLSLRSEDDEERCDRACNHFDALYSIIYGNNLTLTAPEQEPSIDFYLLNLDTIQYGFSKTWQHINKKRHFFKNNLVTLRSAFSKILPTFSQHSQLCSLSASSSTRLRSSRLRRWSLIFEESFRAIKIDLWSMGHLLNDESSRISLG